MKAIVNIGLRKVELHYSIKQKDLKSGVNIVNSMGVEDKIVQKNPKSPIKCKQVIWFVDSDEWESVVLFNGKTVDFHYDYEERKEFKSKKDWGSYLFQGYEHIEGKPQLYDNNIVEKVLVKI